MSMVSSLSSPPDGPPPFAPSRFSPIDAELSCRLRDPETLLPHDDVILRPILSRLVLDVTKFIPRRLVLDAWKTLDDANE
jgi:hypothetical protein